MYIFPTWCVPLRTTLCFLFLRKSSKIFSKLPDMPFCFNWKKRPSCHTLSNAFDISRNTPRISWPSFIEWYISSVIDSTWFIQVSPGLMPVWTGEIRSFWFRKLNRKRIISYGKELSLFISEYCFAKKELKISAFSLKSVTNLFSWNSDGIHCIFYIIENLFNTEQ